MRKILLSLILLYPLAAQAAIQSLSFAAMVKSFDAESVTVEAQGTKVKVPRAAIRDKSLKEQQAVTVTLSGNDLHAYLSSLSEKKPAK